MVPNYTFIQLSQNKPTESVYQDVISYRSNEERIEKLQEVLKAEGVEKVLLFVETKSFADRLGKELSSLGYSVGVMHGDKHQGHRKRTLEDFRRSKIKILIATDVASRGIDVVDISHVINFDAPKTYEDYIHRIGRTGRNGKNGIAFTFVKQ